MAGNKNANAPVHGQGARGAVLSGNLQSANTSAWSVYGGDPIAAFVDAARAAGVVFSEPVVADGVLHRCHLDGDRRGTRNGWYVLHANGIPAGAFGTWSGQISERWRMGVVAGLSHAERVRLDAAIAAARAERERERRELQNRAAARAAQVWAQAAPVESHPYLAAKECRAHGVRQLDNALVIPMRNASGELRAVQTIDGEGEKRFLFGSEKVGLYHAIGGPVTGKLLIGEGYATCASLHEATGLPVAVAFDCGNLKAVAIALREKYPEAEFVICADNDSHTEAKRGFNPGVVAANEAALAVGAKVAKPVFPPTLDGLTDFADLRQWCGDSAVVEAMEANA